jgi:hypothetical protein
MDAGFNSIRDLMYEGKERNIEKQESIEKTIKAIHSRIDGIEGSVKEVGKTAKTTAEEVLVVKSGLKGAQKLAAGVSLIIGGFVAFIVKIQTWF